jgi:SAM-dependent methyltransferase
MQASVIRRQYDDVIAPHYDRDPQSVVGDSLDRAIAQIQATRLATSGHGPIKVLDIGMGTGRFLEKLVAQAGLSIQPFGLDLSEKMIEVARTRIPKLVAAVDDAANIDAHFQSDVFDLVSTHFVTGFVPMELLAPKIWNKLREGGYWSLVGGTKAGFPELQRKANSKSLRWLFGGKTIDVDTRVTNPADLNEAVQTLQRAGFVVHKSETFTPRLFFADLAEFLDFGYWGGWLTPFIEALGLQDAGPMATRILNKFVFPAEDHHNIAIALAQKPLFSVR